MKTITPYLLRFTLTAILLTIVFRYVLSYGIAHFATAIIVLAAGTYFVAMFASGWYFGKKDAEYLPILDIGFRFHFSTYLIHNSISLLWIGLGFASKYETIELPLMVSLFWGIGLLLHFIFFLRERKNAINQLDKEELFD
ncbi:MAG: hypothetical protein CSA96_08015 [Bacteroidetes bacterium]|nr:MAG: hypothetical protein CSA96_08015 [Bacteroidota bacterium]